MDSKPKILFVGEFSQLSTGYSVYFNELISRLYATGKYEIAELACYTTPEDARLDSVPWKVYVNYPHKEDRQGIEEYHNKITYQFGEFLFESVCLDFNPDIVCSIRDWWNDAFIETSPFRRFYNWVYMPTVDSAPQKEEWLSTFTSADAILTYSDWGAEVLKKEGGGLINVMGSASPGADTDIFVPMDKNKIRAEFGFEDDVNIVGMVGRNQHRKLFPELMQAFSMFLAKASPEIARKTYLYLHTSYPDEGWNLPCLIKRQGLSSKLLFTYRCQKCFKVAVSFFQGANAPCGRCKKNTATMPTTQNGITRAQLARIFNLFDCYVQYANSEGSGIPQMEAASCGIPVMSVDYSAMSDVVRKVNGQPIKVAEYRLDKDFYSYRASPNDEDLADKLVKFFNDSPNERRRRTAGARQGIEDNYSWEKTARKWAEVFDSLRAKTSWDAPGITHEPPSYSDMEKMIFETNEQFVEWAIKTVLGRPEKLGSYLHTRILRDLNYGSTRGPIGARPTPYAKESAIYELIDTCENFNKWETKRCMNQK